MSESLTVLFRGTTPEHAAENAKTWARAEGMTIRTVKSIRRRHDLPTWGKDEDPYTDLFPFEVTLAVDALPVPLPDLPTLWGVQ